MLQIEDLHKKSPSRFRERVGPSFGVNGFLTHDPWAEMTLQNILRVGKFLNATPIEKEIKSKSMHI